MVHCVHGALCINLQVKVLEVSRNREGEFSQVARAMTLSGGHTKGVHGVSFNPESTRVVTASVDGSWCVGRAPVLVCVCAGNN